MSDTRQHRDCMRLRQILAHYYLKRRKLTVSARPLVLEGRDCPAFTAISRFSTVSNGLN